MNKLVFAAFLLIIGAVAANEQRGLFHLLKVKPRSSHEVQLILRFYPDYGDHPPIFLESVRPGKPVDVLMEQSKYHVFERILEHNHIPFFAKGPTLVNSIAVRQVVEASSKLYCDCDYHKGGCVVSKGPPAGYACNCNPKAGFWVCWPTVVKCKPHQHCPADCTTKECCLNGGGDCNGYKD